VEIGAAFDQVFGLGLEAFKAAQQWKFRPATRLGEAVSSPMTIELVFTLR